MAIKKIYCKLSAIEQLRFKLYKNISVFNCMSNTDNVLNFRIAQLMKVPKKSKTEMTASVQESESKHTRLKMNTF